MQLIKNNYHIIRLAGAKHYDVESLRRRVHCSLPLRQLSELSYTYMCNGLVSQPKLTNILFLAFYFLHVIQ